MPHRDPSRHLPLPAIFLLGCLLLPWAIHGADVIEQGDRKLFADGLYSRGLHGLALPEYESLSQRTPPPRNSIASSSAWGNVNALWGVPRTPKPPSAA